MRSVVGSRADFSQFYRNKAAFAPPMRVVGPHGSDWHHGLRGAAAPIYAGVSKLLIAHCGIRAMAVPLSTHTNKNLPGNVLRGVKPVHFPTVTAFGGKSMCTTVGIRVKHMIF